MEKKVLYLSQEKLAKYEALMSGEVDYDRNGVKSYETVDSWTVDFGDGLEMDIKVCAGDAHQNDPLWTQGVLFENGAECGCTEVYDQLVGDFVCMRDDELYIVTVLPEGDLTVKDASQLLDAEKFFLEPDDEICVSRDEEESELAAHVDYPLPTVFFDAATTFGVDFHTTPKEELPDDYACEYPLPELKACLSWHPEAKKVTMLIIYEGETHEETYRVVLNEKDEQKLQELLFAKAKEVYGKTPDEEWDDFSN